MTDLTRQVQYATGLSAEETEEFKARLRLNVNDEEEVSRFPELTNLSAAFLYQFMFKPKVERLPEFAYINAEEDEDTEGDSGRGIGRPQVSAAERRISRFVAAAQWNAAWEAGHLRPEWFAEKNDIPSEIRKLAELGGHNIYLLPKVQRTKYYAYAPLYHLLPYQTLQRFGLPMIKRGIWPHMTRDYWLEDMLPADFGPCLADALAYHVWPLLNVGSTIGAFSKNDPIKLLAHNLDFWLPYAYKVAENRLSEYERTDFESEEQRRLCLERLAEMPEDVELNRPRKGGAVWIGEGDAWCATEEMVELADAGGRLRQLVDSVKSNRVVDDFSSKWSYAREDFERKLYHKRAKVKVSFVELPDTIPVHGPESEVHEKLLWEDFLALLDQRERAIVICLRSGVTRVGDISKLMGYSTHSPVSKALARIRRKATRMLM